MLTSTTLEVLGDEKLHCAGCEHRVTRLLEGLDGVRRVRANASTQRVDVQFESALLDTSRIAAHLAQAGYETRIAPTRGQPT